VVDTDGQNVGSIVKGWSGMRSVVSQDRLDINSVPMDLDVKNKALMMGAGILIDYMLFQRVMADNNRLTRVALILLSLISVSYVGLPVIFGVNQNKSFRLHATNSTKARKDAKRPLFKTDKIVGAKMITIVITDLICWLPMYVILLKAAVGLGLAKLIITIIS
ncbi:uncharacterized protein TRIADDRAFT_62898, partial [Trichoplax adhaerens]